MLPEKSICKPLSDHAQRINEVMQDRIYSHLPQVHQRPGRIWVYPLSAVLSSKDWQPDLLANGSVQIKIAQSFIYKTKFQTATLRSVYKHVCVWQDVLLYTQKKSCPPFSRDDRCETCGH